uniref:Immunoglobulin domain-containing protein n=1 Tax=Cyprinus carpio carpio TaxID=630221 RepID=A0A8C1D364_CYPCA
MKIIWTFTLLMIPGVLSSINVTGYSGGGVSITCRYDRRYTDNKKYFCKGRWSECTDRIRTNTKNKQVDSGRFSLYDDTRAAVFTVTIRDLSEQDSDIYYCGTDIYAKVDFYTEVKLNVVTDEKISAVRGYSGGNVIINYKYKTVEGNPLIDVCKTGADQCFTLINTDRAAEWTHDGRFSVHDDRSARLLRVFIRELNENDSGEYKITVKVSEDYSFFSEFHLNIRDADCCEKSISLSAAAGGSVNISCRYPQSHSADVKFVCRRSGSDLCAEETSVKESRRWSAEGQMQLYDDREQQLLTGIISHVTQQHSAEYWCGVQSDQGHKSFITRVLVSVTDANSHRISTSSSTSTSSSSSSSSFSSGESPLVSSVSPITGSSLIISVSVLLLLIFTVILIVIITLWRRRQLHNAHSSFKRSQRTPANIDAASHYHCDYEETEYNHRQLPTNPSDSTNTIYATPQLPINPSDSTNTIYANPEFP